jgi:hypothetical protein
MAELYQSLFIAICLGLLGWGITRPERIYQYPFIMATMFTSFLIPQTFALIKNPGVGVSQEAVERVLFVSCLCAAACWIGYQAQPNIKWLRRLNPALDEHKLFQAGIILMIQGSFFSFLLSRTTVQAAANGNWTGPVTIYLFLSQAGNIAFGFFLLLCLKRLNSINLFLAVFSGYRLLGEVLAGRRQGTMTMIVIIGLSLFLVRRYIPPRGLVIFSVFSIAFLIPLFGEMRENFWPLLFKGDWEGIVSLSQSAFNNVLGGEILELRNAAMFMDASEKLGLYGYGTGWWDSIVFQYVPGQIVGYGLKNSLQFKLFSVEILQDLYGYVVPNGSTFTGIGDSFMELGYMGFLTFALIAYIFKTLYISAVYQSSIASQLLYMGLVSPAMVGLTHGIGRFWQEALFQTIFIGIMIYYARVDPRRSPRLAAQK